MGMYELLKDVIPRDHSRQVDSHYFTDDILRRKNIRHIMDLGCGAGNSIEYFKMKDPGMRWVGVDIGLSVKINPRSRTDGKIIIFDGLKLPFGNDSFDMIFSNQVFEHVKYPRELLKEVHRVLVPGGYFIGSVSYLEPYHEGSLCNYTPYGFKLLTDESKMELMEIRPSIDALTLIIRRGLGRPKFFSRYWVKASPLNRLIDLYGFIMREKHEIINFKKLLFCGQFAFLAQKKL